MAMRGSDEPTVLFVTGMHRSGTSAITSQLIAAGGTALLDLIQADLDNPLGFFESEAVIRINERVLELFGSNWRDPSLLPPDWLERVRASSLFTEAIAIIAAHENSAGTLVLKDPRFSRLLPLWLNLCQLSEVRSAVLAVTRDPVAVARSLWVRNHIPSTHSLQLWCRYYMDLSQSLGEIAYTVIDFESYLENPECLQRGVSSLGLPMMTWDNGGPIIDPGLVHHATAELHTRFEQDLRADYQRLERSSLMEPALLRFHYSVLGGELMAQERRHYGTVAMILDQVIAEREAKDSACVDQQVNAEGEG